MSKNLENSEETRVYEPQPSKKNEKKIQKSKEKTVLFEKKKPHKLEKKTPKNEKHDKKNIDNKVKDKKHQLKTLEVLDATSDEEENLPSENETTGIENESEIEKEDGNTSTTSVDDEVDDQEDFPETQPLLEQTSKKKKKPKLEKQNAVNEKQQKKTEQLAILEGWDTTNQVNTRNIDFSKWQASHSNRETFFIGPDNYIYTNPSTMKKFVDMLKKNQIPESLICIPIKPMSKVVATNPRITIGVTGSRFIYQNGGGYGVTPIFYIAKEYVSCIFF